MNTSDSITVSRNGKQIGVFSASQIQTMVQGGILQPTDMGWKPGLQAWVQLSALVPGLAGPPGLPPAQSSQSEQPNGCLAMVVPIGRSGWAIAAGYFGLFSLCLGLFAPIAIFCGIRALKDIKANPSKMGEGRAWFGIIIGAVSILGWAFFFLMAPF